MTYDWLASIKSILFVKPVVIVCISNSEREVLKKSDQVAVVRKRLMVQKFTTPTMCVLISEKDEEFIYVGCIQRPMNVASLEVRINVKCAEAVYVDSVYDYIQIIRKFAKIGNGHAEHVVSLTGESNQWIIDTLYLSWKNHTLLQEIERQIRDNAPEKTVLEMQQDGVDMSIQIAGLGARASQVEVKQGQETAISSIRKMQKELSEKGGYAYEDNAIAHDGRMVNGYQLIGSDVTGRAVFASNNGRLDVFTANRGPLESVFGVDLIYHNITTGSIIMVQYKMLDAFKKTDDWYYRPDDQFYKEVDRMRKHSIATQTSMNEYRLNPSVFYFKFVPRDAALGRKSFIVPLEHLDQFMTLADSNGPKNGKIISLKSFRGCYLRHGTFISLVQAGYVGSYAKRTLNLKSVIDELLENGRSVVAAFHQQGN